MKIVMLTYLMLSKIYYVKSEYEVENGYLDILLLQSHGVPVDYGALKRSTSRKQTTKTKPVVRKHFRRKLRQPERR
jgi:hypothetical protein